MLSHKPINKWLIGIFIIVSFIGFTDAAYLTIADLTGKTLECSIIHGCGVVTHSRFSHILGIPVALIGTVYYLSIFLSTIWYLDKKNILLLKYSTTFTSLGLIASAWFVYVQAAILHAWCQFCLISAVCCTILFIVGMSIKWEMAQEYKNNQLHI
jgi:uncharacterized membrane protein